MLAHGGIVKLQKRIIGEGHIDFLFTRDTPKAFKPEQPKKLPSGSAPIPPGRRF